MGGIAGSLSCLARRLVAGSVTIRPTSLRSCTRGLLLVILASPTRARKSQTWAAAVESRPCEPLFGEGARSAPTGVRRVACLSSLPAIVEHESC
jgi:hypothetical protein